MEANKFLNKNFLIKVGIIAGVVLVLVIAIVLIVSLSDGGTNALYGKDGSKIVSFPADNGPVNEVVTKITLKGFVSAGDETSVLLQVNEDKKTVVLAVGEKIMDITLTSADTAGGSAVFSVPGTSVTLTLDNPSANFQREEK